MVQAVETEVTPVRGAKPWPMSVEAYHLLGDAGVIPENTELLYGFVYPKMPKSPLHWYLLEQLLDFLSLINLSGFLVRSESPLTFFNSEPEPDIAIVEGTKSDFKTRHPKTAELVIEVCVSSHDYDRSKLRAYATAGVKECWLILGPEKQLEAFSHPKDGVYTRRLLHGPGGIVVSEAVPAVTLDLTPIFA
jgi:Uma2 family endonuclease